MEKHKLLHIVWTFASEPCAKLMVFDYAIDKLKEGTPVHVVVHGACQRMLCENTTLQAALKEFLAAGGVALACSTQAAKEGLLKQLEALGGIKLQHIGSDFGALVADEDEKMIVV